MGLFARSLNRTAPASSAETAPPSAGPRPVARVSRRRRSEEAAAKLATLDLHGTDFGSAAGSALAVVLEGVGVERGALLIYDARLRRLVLGAERGLGVRGRRRLARVQRGDPTCWDMPLHGLLNRRAYLIDRPAENRYVPTLLDAGEPPASRIACVPVYQQRAPVGALVLLAVGRETITDAHVRLLGPALGQLGTVLDELRKHWGVETLPGAAPATGDGAEAGAGGEADVGGATAWGAPSAGPESEEVARDVVTCGAAGDVLAPTESPPVERAASITLLEAREAAARAEAARAQQAAQAAAAEWTARAADWEAERKRLTALVEAAHAEIHAVNAAREQAETIAEAARAAAGEAQGRLAEVTAALEQRRAADAGREREIGLLRAEREKLTANAASLTASLKAALAESRVTAAEAERSGGLEADLAAARGAAAHAEERVRAAEDAVQERAREAATLTETVARLEAERTALAERSTGLECELSALRAALATQEAAARDAEASRGRADAERRAALEREAALREAFATSEAERRASEARLTVELRKVLTERDALQERIESAEARVRDAEAVASAKDSAAADETTRERTALRAAHGEAARWRDEAAALAERAAALDAALGETRREAADLARRLAAADTDLRQRDRAIAALTERVNRVEAARATPVPEPGKGTGEVALGGPSADAEAAAPCAAGEGPCDASIRDGKGPAPAGGSAAPRVVLVEGADAVAKAFTSALGARGDVLRPAGDAAAVSAAVSRSGATVVGLNLGTKGPAGGIHVLRALRQADGAGDGARLWAYVAPPEASKGIPMGFIEWLPLPVASDVLVGLLLRLGARGTRVLSVGVEMDTLLGARAQLAKEGLSLSMAWDSKQGLDLLDVVNPRLVLVNLDLPRGDGFRAIGRLAARGERRTYVTLGGTTPPADAVSLLLGEAVHHSSGAFVPLSEVAAALRADLGLEGGGPAEAIAKAGGAGSGGEAAAAKRARAVKTPSPPSAAARRRTKTSEKLD